MYRIPKLWTWFNNKIRTKDDLQFMLMTIFIVFIIFIKCYMLIFGPAKDKQPANATIQQYNTTNRG
jgi:hypothetical protein